MFARSFLLGAATVLFFGHGKLGAADPVGLEVVVGKDVHGKILSEKGNEEMCSGDAVRGIPRRGHAPSIVGTGIYELRIDPKTGQLMR